LRPAAIATSLKYMKPAGATPLLLTAGEGPWSWRRTRFTLLDGALDPTMTHYSTAQIGTLQKLGEVMRTQDEEGRLVLEFNDATPLRLQANATHAEAGVGSQLWDASIACTLLMRSQLVKLPPAARVIELGAGLGLPSLDLARWSAAATVTLTDARQRLVEVAEQNVAALRLHQPSVATQVAVAQLEWGDGASSEPLGTFDNDVVIGSDICYEPSSVAPLVELLERFVDAVAFIIGPAGRPSMATLRQRLFESTRLNAEERKLTLVCSDADAASNGAEGAHSAGMHSLLIVTPLSAGAAA